MKLSATCALSALMILCTANRLSAELFTVVRMTDLRGNAKYQVCTEAERRKIEADLSEESKALPKAIDAAKTEWVKALNTETFPATRIKPRTIKNMNTAISREEADKLLVQAKLREERTLVKEKEEGASILKTRRHNQAVGEQKQQVREDRKEDKIADSAEALVRKQLSTAAGHDVPFYGSVEDEPKKAGHNKRK
jgi:hypothetical protein